MKFQIRRTSSVTQPFYFRLLASNGQVLAHSENYVSKASALAAINTIKREAASATTEDLS